MGTYKIVLVPGLYPSSRRGVYFLECTPEDKFVNAFQSYFGKLSDRERRDVPPRMENWQQWPSPGLRTDPNWHHGFDDCPDCYCFELRQGHRFYGFLEHPYAGDSDGNKRRFQCCIVVHYWTKLQKHTDQTILEKIKQIKRDNAVRLALSQFFKEKRS